jgi:hypothetical protein
MRDSVNMPAARFRMFPVSGPLAVSGLVWIAVGAACAPLSAQTDRPSVTTTTGVVRGFVQNGVARFLGTPYATPPVGALRWRPPQRHASWTSTLNATAFGPTCARYAPLRFLGADPRPVRRPCFVSCRQPDRRRSSASVMSTSRGDEALGGPSTPARCSWSMRRTARPYPIFNRRWSNEVDP